MIHPSLLPFLFAAYSAFAIEAEKDRLMTLIDVTESTSQYEELRALEKSHPDEHFTEKELWAFLHIFRRSPKGSFASAHSVGHVALRILTSYYLSDLLQKNLAANFLKTVTQTALDETAPLKEDARSCLKVLLDKGKSSPPCTEPLVAISRRGELSHDVPSRN